MKPFQWGTQFDRNNAVEMDRKKMHSLLNLMHDEITIKWFEYKKNDKINGGIIRLRNPTEERGCERIWLFKWCADGGTMPKRETITKYASQCFRFGQGKHI